MTNPVDDKLLEQLYQQRKAESRAPDISSLKALKTNKSRQHPVVRLLSLLGVSSVVSFSIFALISQLIPQTEKQEATPYLVDSVELPMSLEAEDNLNIQSKPKLPEQESRNPLPDQTSVETTSIVPTAVEPVISAIEMTSFAGIEGANDLEVPVLAHKVLPQYPRNALKSKVEGMVKLSFYIDENGNAYNISVISQRPKKVFERSAIKALSQWKYRIPANQQKTLLQKSQVVEFNFTLGRTQLG